MPRLTRQIQAAVRKAQQNGSAFASPLEKIVKQANNELYRQLGIPNVIKLGQSTSGGPSKDRGYAGQAATPGWTGLGVLGQALSKLAWQGGILEVSSPGLQGWDVARQLAAWRASDSRVLWLQLEPAAAAASANTLAEPAVSEGPSLTVQRWPVASPADSRAALQHLVRAVRSQHFALVVLDSVPALAPPLPGAGARARAAAAAGQAAPAPSAAAAGKRVDRGHAAVAAAGAAAGAGAGLGRQPPAAAAAAAVPVAAPAAAGSSLRLGPGAGTGAEAAAQGTRREATARHSGQALPGAATPGSLGSLAAPQRPQMAECATPNYRFLNTELPALMEQALAALAASCGPELPTTTLLVNCYNRATPQQGWMEAGAPTAADATLADRSRWARRAIARHASGTLHLLPATRPSAAVSAAAPAGSGDGASAATTSHGAGEQQAAAEAGALPGAAVGGEATGGTAAAAGPPQSLSQLHVEVTRGLPSGDDGAVLFSGWLGTPPPS
ncbi:hypothetical protein HXX76_000766 [Chlamydomonas incerta]|uniref:Uncharacterized protein n=1 Tax=Chlamydomonas incerta TaxID=51695 RepID=A0A835WEW2_CHLIN|nr:hypothetical protein HXX76_000766 [Chlamydomonas incerta]|eukprot:KAG2446172.1 hypothetical protein HXX76_000766 [Chlamydomonas incerta]